MKVNVGDALVYRDPQCLARYGTGVVVSIVSDQYAILWSRRGLTKYKRSVIDGKLEQIFERIDAQAGLPKERHLSLGASKGGVVFNENYDRARVAVLCERLKLSRVRNTKDLADGLASPLFTKNRALRGAAKDLLLELAELCSARGAACEEARDISRELFFGYVLQKSDFHQPAER